MNTRNFRRTATALLAALVASLTLPGAAAAHCDSLDGPVVNAARSALQQGDVALVLGWVRAGDEAEIREAFDRTLQVRRSGGPAADLADRWFFETLVRVHRAGEGAPYTGLKPAGTDVSAGIEAAEDALHAGTVEGLAPRLAEHVSAAVRERFEHVHRLADHDPADVEAAREYVEAYVTYIHFVEELVAVVHGHGTHGAEAGTP